MNLADEFELTPASYSAAQFAVGQGEVCGFWTNISGVYFVWDTACTYWVELCEVGLENLRDGLKLAAFAYFINLSEVAGKRKRHG